MPVLDITPSGFYVGSYAGPPVFRCLHPMEAFHHSVCLQGWLRHQRVFPLPPGTYALTISFDSSQFPGIRPVGPERTGLWTSPTVTFTVSGSARTDPVDLLDLIAQKVNKRWLRTDLTSRRSDRREEAWTVVYEYGDTRLVPLLEKEMGADTMKDGLKWGPLREFPAEVKPSEKQPTTGGTVRR